MNFILCTSSGALVVLAFFSSFWIKEVIFRTENMFKNANGQFQIQIVV